jgi:signal transduction histidine kinase/ActR/RegA family two-component response regulator
MGRIDASPVAKLLRSSPVNLRTKLLLPLVFVIAGLTGATLLVVRHSAEAQARTQIEQEVSNAILTVQAALNQRELLLSKKADLLATVAYIRNGDPSAIDDAGEDTWQSSDCNLFAIADAKGKVLRVHSTAVGFSSASAKELLARSLKARRSSDWWVYHGRIFQVVLKPYYGEGSLLGTVVVGREFSDKDARDLAGMSSSELLVQANDDIAVNTLSSAASLSAIAELRTRQRGIVTLGDKPFFAMSVPITVNGQEPPIDLTVLKSYESALAALDQSKHLLIALGFGALVLGGLFVYVIADRLTRPLTALARGVRALERGDYAYPLKRDMGTDEVAQLTRAFDDMRTTLRQTEIQKQELEGQLRQSQKMEAMGRLAGGVAHDFNNLLTVIKGNSNILADRLGSEHHLIKLTTQIDGAADRAVSLTRQLLAFCRMQVLQPKILDLNELVSEMCKLLRRLVPEDIAFNFRAGESLGRVKADPGQIEQVIMNLVVNAGDAMPTGGALTVETRNVTVTEEGAARRTPVSPGQYVLLSVTDNGMGMDAGTKARVFEPFFTTKEQGKGTGLGLATVYGIVKQSGGFIWVESEPGKGARFDIYIPRVTGRPETASAEKDEIPTSHAPKTVLVAEDEEAVRELACEFLKSAGYDVLAASNGSEALVLAQASQQPIHALLTDLVMPRMRGPELARRLKALQPQLKVIYVSGYLDYQQSGKEFVEDALFIQKPFNRKTLVTRMAELLKDEQALAREEFAPPQPTIPGK